jgi:hypothetical protein
MPIRDQRRTPGLFTWTSRNQGRLTCNGKLAVDRLCAKRNRGTHLRDDGVLCPSPLLCPALL